jgi:phosphoserine phosphatase
LRSSSQEPTCGSRPILDVVTPEQFHKSILSRNPKVAVFDCDGTLWDGDTGSEFMVWTIETGLVSRETADWIDDRYRLYRKGELSEIAICGEMVQMYAGLSETEVRRAARSFFQQRFERLIFPEMLTLAHQLFASGAEIWAVSSTNTWVVEEGSARFGIPAERVLAAKTRVADHLITPELLDVPTGQGKVDSLRRAGVEHPDVVFGNSIHDAAMLSIAGHAVAIHPSAELRAYAERESWTIHMPAPQSAM